MSIINLQKFLTEFSSNKIKFIAIIAIKKSLRIKYIVKYSQVFRMNRLR